MASTLRIGSAYDVAMVVWVGTMANRYSDSSAEVANYQVLQQLTNAYGPVKGRALFEQLVWTEDPLAPTTVPRSGQAADNTQTAVAAAQAGVADAARPHRGPGVP